LGSTSYAKKAQVPEHYQRNSLLRHNILLALALCKVVLGSTALQK
jgi:hypothetical protein